MLLLSLFLFSGSACHSLPVRQNTRRLQPIGQLNIYSPKETRACRARKKKEQRKRYSRAGNSSSLVSQRRSRSFDPAQRKALFPVSGILVDGRDEIDRSSHCSGPPHARRSNASSGQRQERGRRPRALVNLFLVSSWLGPLPLCAEGPQAKSEDRIDDPSLPLFRY